MIQVNVDNAVILAAGFSSRFVPLCFDLPKGLLPVYGETLIERQIRQLHEVGINDIIVVTGAYAEQFDFLKKKYGITLVFNPDYATKNNFASIYAARDYLGNTMISSSDLFFTKNIFQGTAEHSYYASVFSNGETNQRSLTLDENDKIIGVKYGGKDTWITFGGQAFFTADFSLKLIQAIKPFYDNPEYSNKYWVDFQDADLKGLPMHIKRCDTADIVEFNTLESLWKFDKDFNASEISPTMRRICEELNVENERELSGFEPVRSGNSAVGCSFNLAGRHYKYMITTKK
ncbi:MAG: NTP transferase domain-containing protein [Dysgonamonadaceae bacterium]|jgi:CTP:phosphocholine cytidylyltransferase-like protein|nr:NTP transferase domain-containing protein [Dysgonamonadaceae bacterium]